MAVTVCSLDLEDKAAFMHPGDLFSRRTVCGCVIFVARLARPPLLGCAYASVLLWCSCVFVRLMFLLRWLAWRAHAVWVLLSLLYFYGAHAFFSELEAFLFHFDLSVLPDGEIGITRPAASGCNALPINA